MTINLNFSRQNEYILHNQLIEEYINMYGVCVKLVKTEKLNIDKEVFGDWSSIKTNNNDTFEIFVVPEDNENYQQQDMSFGDFGFTFSDTVNVFVSAQTCLHLGLGINELMGCLIVFPSNKIMEITNAEFNVPGVNNLWAYGDAKSVFKLSLATYNIKMHDELDSAIVNEIEADDIDIFKDVKDFNSNKSDDAFEYDPDEFIDKTEYTCCDCQTKDEFSDLGDIELCCCNDNSDDYNIDELSQDVLDKIDKLKQENLDINDITDKYIDTLMDVKKQQDYESEVNPIAQKVNINRIDKGLDQQQKTAVIDNNEQDIFGW